MSLKRRPASVAAHSARSINQRLEDYWLGLRLQQMDLPAIRLVKAADGISDDGHLLSDARDLYPRLKGINKDCVFSSIRSIINLAIKEQGLEAQNGFSGIFLPEDLRCKGRQPIPIKNIHKIETICRSKDDDLRWLIALIGDTGMRLAEATFAASAKSE